MLHITNGSAAADVMRAAGIAGEILTWDDVLHEGPVPAGLSLEELSEVRARHLWRRGWVAPERAALEGFAARDDALSRFREHGEVVLWFEHDLYDQLQLAQLLDWFADQEMDGIPLTMVCGAEYLGMSTPERLAARFREREPVTDAQLALGEAAWNAFRSPDPTAISALLDGDTAALPWMSGALRRHLEQFPSTDNGLSRSERQVLEALAAGPSTPRDLFLAHNAREDPFWLGDSTFVAYLHDLAAGDAPLIHLGSAENSYDMRRRVEMTDAGRAVLDGREDRVRLCGIDRWLGGVHLRGHSVGWRWSPGDGRLVVSDA
jgi:hypothetical protein